MITKHPGSIALAAFVLAALILPACGGGAKEGNTVKVRYTGKLADGTVFDSSAGRDPLVVVLGQNQVIPGFEKALLGMKKGEKKTVQIPVAEAYGPVRPELVAIVEKDKLPPEREPKVGETIMSRQPDGQAIRLLITAVDEKTVTLDANHPLAGKDLTFELEMMEISK